MARHFRHVLAFFARRVVTVLPAAALGLALSSGVGFAQSKAPVGHWLTEDHSGVIEISPCGDGLCGRIVGMAEWPDNGSVPVDIHGRPECGLTILSDTRPHSDDRWAGRITDPDTGHVYDAQLWVDQAGQLHLRGYVGVSLLGHTQVWTPYRASVPSDCRLGQSVTASRTSTQRM